MANKPLTVVVVNDFDYVQGGASKVAIDTANLLYEKDMNIIFFSSTHKENNYKFKQVTTNQKECLKDGIKGAFRGLYNFKAAKEFKKLLRALDRDNTIIHVHGWTKSLSSSIFRTAFKMKFKVVLTLHDYFTACPNGGFFNYKKNQICKYNPLSSKCLMCNCDSRNYLFKIYRIIRQVIQKNNMKHLKNVITISDFSENILKKEFDNNVKIYRIDNPIDLDKNNKIVDYKKNKYFLYVGRISKEKGVDIFCEAVTKLKLKAIVVGDGNQKERLAKKYSNVRFVGWKNNVEVKKYMKNAKALVFPSRWYEGAPLTPLEALQYGIPCLVSSCCAAKDYIIEFENGFLFDDVEQLIYKLKSFDTYKFKFKKIKESQYTNEIIKLYKYLVGREI